MDESERAPKKRKTRGGEREEAIARLSVCFKVMFRNTEREPERGVATACRREKDCHEARPEDGSQRGPSCC